jgi:hypothetical protein
VDREVSWTERFRGQTDSVSEIDVRNGVFAGREDVKKSILKSAVDSASKKSL